MAQVHPGHLGHGSLVVSLDDQEDYREQQQQRTSQDHHRIVPPSSLRSRPTPPSSTHHSLKRLSTTSDQFALDAEDSSTRSITPSAGPGPGHHSRSNSLRRKPVPCFLPTPNISLPSSHPFASALVPPGGSASSTPPADTRTDKDKDKDLFYFPTKRGLPAPPRPLSIARKSTGTAASLRSSGSGSDQEIGALGKNGEMGRKEQRPEIIPSRSSSLRMASPSASRDVTPVPPLESTISETHGADPTTPTISTASPVVLQTPSAGEDEHDSAVIANHDPQTPRQPHAWTGTLGTPIPAKGPGGTQRLTRNFGMPNEEKGIPTAAANGTGGPRGPVSQAEKSVQALTNGTGEEAEDESFSIDRLPSKRRLFEAGTLFVRDENGEPFCVGDLFPKYPTLEEQEASNKPLPKTVLLFIRNWGCGQCQDYMFASVSQLDPEVLEKANVKVVIIGCGGWKTIKAYRALFKCPFPLYVDTTRKLYTLLGMTKYTNNFGPWFKGRAAYHQRPVPTQVIHGMKNMIKHMPLSSVVQPGKILQLGGEFILSPGFKCDFAHRMTTTSNHIEAPDVLRRAGVPYPTKAESAQARHTVEQEAELARMQEEMTTWRKGREAELDRIRRKKAARRGEEYKPATRASMIGMGLDEELDQLPLERAPTPPSHLGHPAHQSDHAADIEGDGERDGNADGAADAEYLEEDLEAGMVCARVPGGGAEEILLDDDMERAEEYEPDLELSSLHRLNSEELDRRFSAAMKLEEQRERELQAAGELREAPHGGESEA